MALDVISEVCYTCRNCLVTKQICNLKRRPIMNIYRDRCDKYCQRDMHRCKLCGAYVIELAQHVRNFHQKTMGEYLILTKDLDDTQIKLRRKSLWE